jgi:hypothetical protein
MNVDFVSYQFLPAGILKGLNKLRVTTYKKNIFSCQKIIGINLLPKPPFHRLSFLYLVVACLALFQCTGGRKEYRIEIRHFAANAGMILYYSLNDHYIQVETQCELKDCKRETVYKRVFLKGQSDSIFRLLEKIQLDTLHQDYHSRTPEKGGLTTSIEISGDDLPEKKVQLTNMRIPATDSLFNLIDRLILSKDLVFP